MSRMQQSHFSGAVILAGAADFMRCPIAGRIPVSLWPLIDRPLIYHQLGHLTSAGVSRVALCISADVECDLPALLDGVHVADLSIVRDEMPRGSAGALADAIERWQPGPVLVMDGTSIFFGDLAGLAAEHKRAGAVMTVLTGCGSTDRSPEVTPAGIYVTESTALDGAEDGGFIDLKEVVIPRILRSGGRIRALPARDVSVIAGRRGYLEFLARALAEPQKYGIDMTGYDLLAEGIWRAPGVSIGKGVRFEPPVVICEGVVIGDGSVVVGPAVIAGNVKIGARCVIDASSLWEGSAVSDGSCISESIVDSGAVVSAARELFGEGVGNDAGTAARVYKPLWESAMSRRRGIHSRPSSAECEVLEARRDMTTAARPLHMAALGAVLLGALVWSYWEVIRDLAEVWRRNDNFSSGALVPFLAAYVVYVKRKSLSGLSARPCYWGLALVASGFAMRFFGSLLLFASVERFSLVVVLIGLAITVFGIDMVGRFWGVVAFLFLMLPWPNRIYYAVSLPLQTYSTSASVFLLEVLGVFVIREGHILQIGDTAVAVTEACSGLRLLTAFLVISALAALISTRPMWQKGVILASSIPIAIICNTFRLTVTSLAYTAGYGEQFNDFFHDFGGLAMMPLALGLLGAEMWLLGRLVVPAESSSEDASEDI